MSTTSPATSLANPADRAEAQRRLWEVACNVLLSLMFLRFAIAQGAAVYETLRISNMLMLAKVSTDVFFYLIRSLPKGVSLSLYDWTVGIVGTFAIVLFQPEAGARDIWVGQALQWTGIGLQVLAMLSLNRSIGMVAANRGVKTNGLYRFMRHPLYFSYIVAFLGYVVNHASYWNGLIYAMAVLLWVLRLLAEERFLLRDPAYQQYAERVRYRLIPGIF